MIEDDRRTRASESSAGRAEAVIGTDERRGDTLRAQRPLIMICEDEPLLAMDLEDDLATAGARVLGPLSAQRDALAVLNERRPDAAVIDIELKDGACSTLAAALSQQDIPFVIVSGFTRPHEPPPAFARAEWLRKPVDRAALVAELERLLATKVA